MLAYQAAPPSVAAGQIAVTTSPKVGGELAGEVLDLLNVGLILVSATSRILGVNGNGANCLDDRDGLWAEGGLLAAEAVTETLQLRSAIREAVEKGRPGGMLVRRTRGMQPHMVMIQPVGDGDGRHAVVAVRNGHGKSPALADRVRSLFRLGPAEADIAVQLARGSDIQEIAVTRGVTINTIRTQLASAMVKVGVRRQAELVAAVASLDVLA